MKRILLILPIFLLVFASCSSDDNVGNTDVQKLPKIDNVSLNYHPSEQTISLPRDVGSEGATISLKDNSYWIAQLKLSGEKVSFRALENTDIETGHRFDTIVISIKNERIGSICVSQARKPISQTRLQWAASSAMYRNSALGGYGMTGKEITKAVYNLSKTTNGKDSYKNYPAFAFCIDMNHDPENNMEWHLASDREMAAYAKGQSYKGTPFYQHNYWWTASENVLTGDAFSLYSESTATRGAERKGTSWWVMAFKNGKMEE